MNLFWVSKRYDSEKNGSILCLKYFNSWSVLVDGYYQTSPYTNRMWRRALKRLPTRTKVKKILVLGLGAGGIIPILNSSYPHCSVTAIEWDPVMIGLASELGYITPTNRPKIIEGDAQIIVPNLSDKFDLIIIDLFLGNKAPQMLSNSEFLRSLDSLLAPSGHLIVNVFLAKDLLSVFESAFKYLASWIFKYNQLALYQKENK